MALISKLRQVNKRGADEEPSTSQQNEKELEMEAHMQSILDKHRLKPKIPVFYRAKPKANTIQDLLHREAKLRAMRVRQEAILSQEDLRRILDLLVGDPMTDEDEANDHAHQRRLINYDEFCQVATHCREVVGPHVLPCFKASVFLRFKQDNNGCIQIDQFFQYLQLRAEMQSQHLHLTYYADEKTGTMTKEKVEEFIHSLILEMSALQDMKSTFHRWYQRICARKLLFFHAKNGLIRVHELLASDWLMELNELRSASPDDPALLGNWFSYQSTMRVYNTFMSMDVDGNGLLSCAEFSAISSTMSQLFIRRIYEEHVAREGHSVSLYKGEMASDEMDLLAFTDFVLAWDNRSHRAAVRYFFPIFDLDRKGFITPADIYVFFKEIHVMWVNGGEYSELSIYDVVDEIIDMIRPENGPNITPQDLERSGMSGTFFNMLSDWKQFYDYNYRENQIHQDDNN